VIYIDDDGRQRRHTFDFLLKMKDGTRGFVAVKPFALVKKTGIGRVVELAAEQIPPSLAEWTLLFTEQDLLPIDLFTSAATGETRLALDVLDRQPERRQTEIGQRNQRRPLALDIAQRPRRNDVQEIAAVIATEDDGVKF
jgi:hypothetical protein